VVLVLVDGLGFLNLGDGLGHAPFLRSRVGSAKRMTTVFPSTTASALASLTTGVLPGTHGILGYRIRNPRTGNIINQLSGLTDIADLDSWLGVPTLHELARSRGVNSTIVGLPRFEQSPLTRVVHAGARYVGANNLVDRVGRVCDEVASGTAFVLLYIPELDQLAHAQGVTSMAWLEALEEVDGALRELAAAVPRGVQAYLTADHGVLDVPSPRHDDVASGDWNLPGDLVLGGEPRGIQIFCREGHPVEAQADIALPEGAREIWNSHMTDTAWIVTPEDLVSAGLWGAMTDDVRLRAGELIVVPRHDAALYDARSPGADSRKMVGQHGGLSERELIVPWMTLTETMKN
jgi:predicted AlkP superfamily pyrophosphatase or phosphodiesterase